LQRHVSGIQQEYLAELVYSNQAKFYQFQQRLPLHINLLMMEFGPLINNFDTNSERSRDKQRKICNKQPTSQMSNKTYLIIGGGGFLGRYIVEQLLERGEKNVKIFDLRKTWDDPRVEFIVGDLTKLDSVTNALKVRSFVRSKKSA
jgi:FlaA1/EpsC-like NDP-sugar epimerase